MELFSVRDAGLLAKLDMAIEELAKIRHAGTISPDLADKFHDLLQRIRSLLQTPPSMLRRKENAGRREGIWPPHSPLGHNDESVKTAKNSREDGRRSAKSDKWEPSTLTDATCENCAPCFLNRINAKSGAVQALPCIGVARAKSAEGLAENAEKGKRDGGQVRVEVGEVRVEVGEGQDEDLELPEKVRQIHGDKKVKSIETKKNENMSKSLTFRIDTEDKDGEREQGDDFREMDFAAALLEMDGHVAALRKLMEHSIKDVEKNDFFSLIAGLRDELNDGGKQSRDTSTSDGGRGDSEGSAQGKAEAPEETSSVSVTLDTGGGETRVLADFRAAGIEGEDAPGVAPLNAANGQLAKNSSEECSAQEHEKGGGSQTVAGGGDVRGHGKANKWRGPAQRLTSSMGDARGDAGGASESGCVGLGTSSFAAFSRTSSTEKNRPPPISLSTRGTKNQPYRVADGTWVKPKKEAVAGATAFSRWSS